jgi:hypothetical protein
MTHIRSSGLCAPPFLYSLSQAVDRRTSTYPNTRSTLQSLPIHSYIPPGSSNLGQISRTPWKRLHHLSSRFVTEVKISETPQLQCTRTAYKYTFLADFFSEHRCIRDLILPFFGLGMCMQGETSCLLPQLVNLTQLQAFNRAGRSISRFYPVASAARRFQERGKKCRYLYRV